jgi:hypothetical protein
MTAWIMLLAAYQRVAFIIFGTLIASFVVCFLIILADNGFFKK